MHAFAAGSPQALVDRPAIAQAPITGHRINPVRCEHSARRPWQLVSSVHAPLFPKHTLSRRLAFPLHWLRYSHSKCRQLVADGRHHSWITCALVLSAFGTVAAKSLAFAESLISVWIGLLFFLGGGRQSPPGGGGNPVAPQRCKWHSGRGLERTSAMAKTDPVEPLRGLVVSAGGGRIGLTAVRDDKLALTTFASEDVAHSSGARWLRRVVKPTGAEHKPHSRSRCARPAVVDVIVGVALIQHGAARAPSRTPRVAWCNRRSGHTLAPSKRCGGAGSSRHGAWST